MATGWAREASATVGLDVVPSPIPSSQHKAGLSRTIGILPSASAAAPFSSGCLTPSWGLRPPSGHFFPVPETDPQAPLLSFLSSLMIYH